MRVRIAVFLSAILIGAGVLAGADRAPYDLVIRGASRRRFPIFP